MDRASQRCVVDEPHNRLAALFNDEGRTGRDSIVADHGCIAFVRIDILSEGRDVYLVVIYGVACDRVGDGSAVPSLTRLEEHWLR